MTCAEKIAAEMERLSRVEDTDDTAGYCAFESSHYRDAAMWDTISWYCGGGNAGHPVFAIHPLDEPELLRRLQALPDRALDGTLNNLPAFKGLRIEMYV